MELVRMHGTGNVFLVLDAFRRPAADADLPALARAACDRTAGLGADGLLVVGPADGAAARMTVFNADGSSAEMCGNGLRCVAKLLADRGHAGRETTIVTGGGPRRAEVLAARGEAAEVRIGLGRPVFEADRIPTTLPGTPPVEAPLDLDGGPKLLVTCVSMGNPHAVTFWDDPEAVPVDRVGPAVERHPAFPNRTNVGFASAVSPAELRLRVWERGVGETAACGTGAAAAAVAAVLTGRAGRDVLVRLRGGDLRVTWTDDGEVLLTGEAVTVGAVEWPPERA